MKVNVILNSQTLWDMAMGAKSKTKGNNGELALAKILSATLGGSFVRSNGSGAFIGGKNMHRKTVLSENQIRNTKGDICPPDDMSRLVVEVKSYALVRYHQIFQQCPLLDDWIEQARSAADEGDFWLLAFKSNRVPWSVAFDANLIGLFNIANHAIYDKTVITDLDRFVSTNKDRIIELSQNGTI